MIRILVGGDTCPVGRSQHWFQMGDAAAVFTDLLEEFKRADLRIVNLECPLVGSPSPIRKVGPALAAPPECIRGIRDAGIDVVGLANNHILDHGPQGLAATLSVCRRHGVATVGAGANLGEAGRLLIHRAGGIRVGIVAAAEHEFSVATETSAGANALDLIRLLGSLRAARESCEVLVVLLHAGNEFHPYPSPRLQKLCRFLVAEGAGAVVCQHSHRPGCVESHAGGHIIYGQGNLVFDRHPYPQEFWYEGFLAVLEIEAGASLGLRVVPYRQFDGAAATRRLRGAGLESFLAELGERSRRVVDEEFVERAWRRFCRENRAEYLAYLSGHSQWTRYLHQWLPFLRRPYSLRRKLLVRSVIQCESHREVLETVLSDDDAREVQP